MADEGEPTHPPTGNDASEQTDKSKAPPKGPTHFSAFINKNTSSKKFAPKAVRRRPGAAAAAAAPKPLQVPPPTPTVESQTESPSQAPPTIAPPVEPQPAPQLPTPAATQELSQQDAPRVEDTIAGPSGAAAGASTASSPPPAVAEPLATGAPTNVESPPNEEASIKTAPQVPPHRGLTPHPAEENVEPRSSPKRRREGQSEAEMEHDQSPKRPRIESTEGEGTLLEEEAVQLSSTPSGLDNAAPAQTRESGEFDKEPIVAPISEQPTEEISQPESAPADASAPEPPAKDAAQPTEPEPTQPSEPPAEALDIPSEQGPDEPQATVEKQAPGPSTRARRRRLPWVAVNAPQSEDGQPVAPTKRTRRAAARTRNKAAAPVESEHEEEQEDGEEEDSRPAPKKRPSAKARGKRKVADADPDEDAEEEEPPAKKPRKTRKDKGKKRNAAGGGGEIVENGEAGDGAEAQETRPKRKRRTKKRTNAQPAEGAEGAAEGEGDQQPRRKGRPRAATPSDAEDHQIDEAHMTMDSLASRDLRFGKVSEREKKMRTVDWAAVNQRRRDEQQRLINFRRGSQDEAEVNRRLDEAGAARDEAAQQANSVQVRLVNGQIEVVHNSGAIDREGDADREIAMMEVIEEDDITQKVNTRSWIRNNKRRPAEYMLPGEGKRWNIQDTEDFYRALQMCGTNFEMMTTLFVGVTRRSIKKKFIREERSNPQRIKETLHGKRNSDWNQYLAESGRKEDAFVDVDEIKRQMEEVERAAMVEIEKAKLEAEEEKRQRRAAGYTSEDDRIAREAIEMGKKRKKKEKPKPRPVQETVFDDEGAEIVGYIDDDEV